MPLSPHIIDKTLASKQGEAALAVVEKMMDAGYECYFVGGAVRDMAFEKVPHEIDMTTSALPEQTAKIFPKSDSSAAHLGTVVVSHQGHTFEVTTYREDHSVTDGRRPESVKFGTKEKDALRRDATMNAMYWNPVTEELYDPCEGMADVKHKLVRFVGEPGVGCTEVDTDNFGHRVGR